MITDFNGNISTLLRKNSSGTTIDNLSYTYVGNQLDYINDSGTTVGVNNSNSSGTDYTYDDSGNMEWDKNKDIKIDYNYLNLPEKVYEESGTGDELLYIYDANGTKWLKKLTDGSTISKTMYAGSFVYEDNDSDAVDDFGIDYILTTEGKIDVLASSEEYRYHLKDHLGNTRVVFDGMGTVKQKTDYYPFGMTSYQYSSSNDNKYLYNGKELQDEQLGGVNLDWYDFNFRYYDPALGRFTGMDPIAENFYYVTPYNYAENDPVGAIDLWGLQKLRITAKVKLTSGIFGIKAKILGVPIGGSISAKGAGEQVARVYLEYDKQSTGKKFKFGVSHVEKKIWGGHSAAIGIHGGESNEMNTTHDWNTSDGSSTEKDQTYKKKEEGGVGPVTTEEEDGVVTVKSDFDTNAEVNLGLVGVGLGVDSEFLTKEQNIAAKKAEEEAKKKNEDETP